MSAVVERRLVSEGITFNTMEQFVDKEFKNAVEFKSALKNMASDLEEPDLNRVIELSELRDLTVNTDIIKYEISQGLFTTEQVEILNRLNGRSFKYSWELRDELRGHPVQTGNSKKILQRGDI